MIAGLLVGASTAVVVPLAGTCHQAMKEITDPSIKCDCCQPGVVNGPPPAGFLISLTLSSCQLGTGCVDCCMATQIEVSGSGAYGVVAIDCNTGNRYEDFVDPAPYYVSDLVRAPCLTNTSTYNCLQVSSFWATGVIGMDTRCYRLDCTMCQ